MTKRLISALLPTLLAATFLMAQERPTQPASQPGSQPGSQSRTQAGRGDAGDRGGLSALDGTWTVVSAARDGKAVDGADKLTVTIRGGVVSFAGGDADKTKMRSMRLDFGPHGMVRVSEANADGRFDTTGSGGTGASGAGSSPGGTTRPGGGTGTTPGGTGSGTQTGGTGTTPGTTGSQTGGTAGSSTGGSSTAGSGTHGGMMGLYVMTPEYLAVSVFDAGAGARPGGTGTTPGGSSTTPGSTTPGRTGSGTTPGGSSTTPGGTGTGTQSGTTGSQTGGTGSQTGGTTSSGAGSSAGAGATGGGPHMNSHISVILKKNGGSSSGTTRP